MKKTKNCFSKWRNETCCRCFLSSIYIYFLSSAKFLFLIVIRYRCFIIRNLTLHLKSKFNLCKYYLIAFHLLVFCNIMWNLAFCMGVYECAHNIKVSTSLNFTDNEQLVRRKIMSATFTGRAPCSDLVNETLKDI